MVCFKYDCKQPEYTHMFLLLVPLQFLQSPVHGMKVQSLHVESWCPCFLKMQIPAIMQLNSALLLWELTEEEKCQYLERRALSRVEKPLEGASCGQYFENHL